MMPNPENTIYGTDKYVELQKLRSEILRIIDSYKVQLGRNHSILTLTVIPYLKQFSKDPVLGTIALVYLIRWTSFAAQAETDPNISRKLHVDALIYIYSFPLAEKSRADEIHSHYAALTGRDNYSADPQAYFKALYSVYEVMLGQNEPGLAKIRLQMLQQLQLLIPEHIATMSAHDRESHCCDIIHKTLSVTCIEQTRKARTVRFNACR